MFVITNYCINYKTYLLICPQKGKKGEGKKGKRFISDLWDNDDKGER